MPDHRRLGTLIAFVLNLEAIAFDLLDILITEIFADATRAGEKARLRTIKDLDEAAVRLGQVCALLLDPSVADSTLRDAVFAVVKREDLEAALRQVESLVRPPEDMYYRELKESYRRVRTFLPSLLQTVRFGATPAGRPVLEVILPAIAGRCINGERKGQLQDILNQNLLWVLQRKDFREKTPSSLGATAASTLPWRDSSWLKARTSP
jgi:hypothetical protein